MNACFVNIGTNKNGLLELKDMINPVDDITGNTKIEEQNLKINDYIKQNDKILVQVKRDSTKLKGTKLTCNIKLTGKYIIYMPYCNFITSSRKNEKTEKQEKIKKEIENYLDGRKCGVILRSSCKNADLKAILEEVKYLENKFKLIKQKFEQEDNPQILYDKGGIIQKLITDLFPYKLEVVSNNKSLLDNLEKENKGLKINFKEKIETELKNEKKVYLKNGGFLIIEKTEALWAIDVNTGKNNKEQDDKMKLKINLDAALEISKQIRLKDIGGIIIIDFINMSNKEYKEKLKKYMEDCLMKNDRAKSEVVDYTKLNLLEVTRKPIFEK